MNSVIYDIKCLQDSITDKQLAKLKTLIKEIKKEIQQESLKHDRVQTRCGNYIITQCNSMYTCTCKDFQYRIGEPVEKKNGCKHIR